MLITAVERRNALSWSWDMTVSKAEQNQPSQLKGSLQRRDREQRAARGITTCPSKHKGTGIAEGSRARRGVKSAADSEAGDEGTVQGGF